VNIYWLQTFWFGETLNNSTNTQMNYMTIDLPNVNIYANIWLSIFSQGFDFNNKIAGLAAAGIKGYGYIDKNGIQRSQELDHWESHLYIEKCISIKFAFHVRMAWAKAEGMIYWYA
jgi:hypothetical protein